MPLVGFEPTIPAFERAKAFHFEPHTSWVVMMNVNSEGMQNQSFRIANFSADNAVGYFPNINQVHCIFGKVQELVYRTSRWNYIYCSYI
jgi:hypothetical protein